jgi:hypothetical protein
MSRCGLDPASKPHTRAIGFVCFRLHRILEVPCLILDSEILTGLSWFVVSPSMRKFPLHNHNNSQNILINPLKP